MISTLKSFHPNQSWCLLAKVAYWRFIPCSHLTPSQALPKQYLQPKNHSGGRKNNFLWILQNRIPFRGVPSGPHVLVDGFHQVSPATKSNKQRHPVVKVPAHIHPFIPILKVSQYWILACERPSVLAAWRTNILQPGNWETNTTRAPQGLAYPPSTNLPEAQGSCASPASPAWSTPQTPNLVHRSPTLSPITLHSSMK